MHRQLRQARFRFGPTKEELNAKVLELLVRLREVMAADAAAEAYQKAAELLKAVYLAGSVNAKAYVFPFRRQRKMIEGRVEKD